MDKRNILAEAPGSQVNEVIQIEDDVQHLGKLVI